jgi:hypothetical protein
MSYFAPNQGPSTVATSRPRLMGVEAGSLVEYCSHFGGYLVLQILPGVRLEPLDNLCFGYSLPLLGVTMVRAFWQLATPHFEPIDPLRSSALELTVDSDWLFEPMDSASSWVLF